MPTQHPLSFLDQQPHIRNFGRSVTIFSFPDAQLADHAVETLVSGLAATIQRFPQLAGMISIPDRATGNLQLWYPSHLDARQDASRIFTADFSVARDPDLDYDKLRHEHFEPSRFSPEIFCPRLLRNHPGLDDGDTCATGVTNLLKGIPLPVMAVQATFIPGGMVLSFWGHHCLSDGAGSRRIYEIWSKSARGYARRGVELKSNVKETGALNSPHELDDLAYSSTPEPKRTCPTPPHVPLRETPYNVVTRLFRFPSSMITHLAKTLSRDLNTHITSFAALSSLL
jgi:hypothetical protein